MKKMIKIATVLGVAGVFACGALFFGTRTYAMEEKKENVKEVLKEKNYDGYEIYKGKSTNDGTFDIYYSDGYFKEDASKYNPHMATLAMNLANSSNMNLVNGDYSHGAEHLTEALGSIGFKDIYVSDTYTKKPTSDSIACVIASKKLEQKKDMKYKYAIDISIRSAGYEAEWISNVSLGKEGEAKGFKEASEKIMNTYLKEYFDRNKDFNKYLANGEVAFYVNGYSRGGATANLTAKKLIDKYQKAGNGVYAYCIEAPQGGRKEEIDPNRCYNGIHNIINPNDLVCYVAPTRMGFMRYGVDHYIAGGDSIKDKPYEKGVFFESKADNQYDHKIYLANKDKAIKELKTMLNKEDVSKYAPYEVSWKQFDLRHFKLNDARTGNTYELIQNFMDGLMLRAGKITINRERYSQKLEGAAGRILEFMFKNPDIEKMKTIDNVYALISPFESILGTLAKNVEVSADTNNPFVATWRFLFSKKSLRYSLNITDKVRNTLAQALVDTISSQKEAVKVLNDSYPTKAKGALEDIRTIVLEVLSGSNNIDSFLTFGMNINGIFNNHTMLQTLAWLRIQDSFYTNAKQ